MILAEKLHAALAEYWTDLTPFSAWPNKGAAWYTLASHRDELLEPPEQRDPYEQDLMTPVPVRYKPGTDVVFTESPPNPTSLRIRPMVAVDLCLPECAVGGHAYAFAKQARVHGVSLGMLDTRIHPADQELGERLISDATGDDAPKRLIVLAVKAGLGLPDAVNFNYEIWESMTYAMFVTECDDHCMVACRTPGLGTVKVGPYRSRHKRIWADTAEATDEWSGRIAALASLTELPQHELEQARVEDVVLLWSAFMSLKKNASEAAYSKYMQILSARSSTTDPPTSTDGPTPS